MTKTPQPTKFITEKTRSSAKSALEPELLKGWQQIARFLGQPVSVAERWAHQGMPVKKQGKFVVAASKDLRSWLGKESGGEPIHVATNDEDLALELRRGLAYVRKQERPKRTKT